MSGILNNPLSNSGGSSIPLAAGQGVGAPANPLDTIGKFASIQNALNQNKMFPGALRLQGQEIQSNQLALAQRLKQTAYQHLAAGVADGSISDIGSATSALASLEHNYGIPTDGVIQDITNLGGNGPDFQSRLKGLVVANTQKPENAVAALAPQPGTVQTGGQIIPTLTPNAGLPGQGVPVPSAPGFEVGYTPGQRLPTITRPATASDVAADPRLTLGQAITVPATAVPAAGGFNPGSGGARVPMAGGNLGSGGYNPPQRPLTQLGPAFRPAGAPAPSAAPTGGSPPGSRLMKGPGGTFMVPPDKIGLYQQNGYQ